MNSDVSFYAVRLNLSSESDCTSHGALSRLSAGQHIGDNYHGAIAGEIVVAGGQGNTNIFLSMGKPCFHPYRFNLS
jgi:hypothetical protein